MPFRSEVGLVPDHIVLDGDPAPLSSPKKAAAAHTFGSCLLWINSWMDQDATWYRASPQPGHIVLDGDPAPALPPGKGVQQTPAFWPMSIVAKRSFISATAELLFNLTFTVKDCSICSIHDIDAYTAPEAR